MLSQADSTFFGNTAGYRILLSLGNGLAGGTSRLRPGID
jgi:hypothetical protein